MNRWLVAAICGLLVAAGALRAAPAGASTVTDAFIAGAISPAQTTQHQYDVPASVAMGQAALESNWGRSTLTVNDKNFFGFKCVSASDPGPIATACHNYPTTECTPGCHTVNRIVGSAPSFTAEVKPTFPRSGAEKAESPPRRFGV